MQNEEINNANIVDVDENPDDVISKAFLGDTDVSIEDDNEIVGEDEFPNMDDFDIDISEANEEVDADQPNEEVVNDKSVEESDDTPETEDDTYQYIDTEWLGENRKFDLKNDADRADAKQLIQKGRDYDRIREAYDVMSKDYAEGKYALEVLESMKGDFESVADLVDDIVARNILNENGADVTDATIKSVMSSAKNKREESKKKFTMNAIREESSNAKRDADVAHFLKVFPDVNSNQITQDVWDEMNSKKISLTEAWLSKQNKDLNKKISELDGKLKTEIQHNKNKSRSVGSAKSTSSATELSDFYSGAKELFDDW